MIAPSYVGWLRTIAPDHHDAGPWLRACEAPTYRDCWTKLLDIPVMANHVERLVGPKGKHPEQGRTTK